MFIYSKGKDLIALRWELYNRGKTFNRKDVWKKADIVQEGIIKHNKGKNRKVTVWKTPQSTDKKLRKKVKILPMYTTINLIEKIKGDDDITYWKIGEERYVNADYVSRGKNEYTFLILFLIFFLKIFN